MSPVSSSSNHGVNISSADSLLWSTDEGGSHVGLLSVAKVWITDTAAFFDGRLKDFAIDRREVDGSELSWVCCAVGFCNWSYYCAAPIFSGLGSLE